MDAIVLAGGVPKEDDLLYELTQGKPKALLEIAGKPMAQWVLDAIGGSSKVDQVVTVGLSEDSGLRCTKPMRYVPNQGGMLQNVLAGGSDVQTHHQEALYVLCVSADIPALTTEAVDWVIDAATETEDDVYYNVIAREVMEKRFSGSHRSFFHFRDGEICGGDLVVLATSVFSSKLGVWDRLMAARKSRLKSTSIIGLDVLFLYLIHRLTLDKLVSRASSRIGVCGRALRCPYPEVGMDVDKPFQFEMVQGELLRRSGS
jgi:molybdopterin-guanine dinucleotide biosynthesis protein A